MNDALMEPISPSAAPSMGGNPPIVEGRLHYLEPPAWGAVNYGLGLIVRCERCGHHVLPVRIDALEDLSGIFWVVPNGRSRCPLERSGFGARLDLSRPRAAMKILLDRVDHHRQERSWAYLREADAFALRVG